MVVSGLREAIMGGDYRPGSPLGEVGLAKRFGVSRGPIREALIQLEREYLVRSFPNRGCFVTTLVEQEFDEIIMLRSVLEPIALARARENAKPRDVAAIHRRFRDLHRIALRGDQREFIRKDREFHLALWEICRQPLLKEVLTRISTPVFMFETLLEERYRKADYDLKADVRAHRLMVDYLAGKTHLDASACLEPLWNLMAVEKSIVLHSRPN